MQPLCEACLIDGLITQGNHVDHLFPWSVIGPHAFTQNWFQTLCESHHGVKSGLEKRGIYRYYNKSIHDYAIDDYSRII